MEADPRDDDNGLTVVVLAWTLLIVSILVVSLRVYTRITRVRNVRADDYLMICSVVSSLLRESYASLTSLAVWIRSRHIPHYCVEERFRKTL